ncbi:MerR family transcriptional regulator [Paenibacillus athensensis]|uniref:MerR family transcriptional regulator n=1 Tax=Paenibacillus athensensis TaxID=1967502 RepID=A0A4Y8Q1V6_9BACL|nr:MerR family transcriptional regulator [Paenibacillus athensensis]MCD1261023.1 MerR family transcriptional regulator [Paenibacillus athensensis]
MYTIKKVSEWLDIPAVTIRAWENRYGLVKPLRTEGGHRLYRDEDVATLRWVKRQLEEKQLRISEVVRALAAQKDASMPELQPTFTPHGETDYAKADAGLTAAPASPAPAAGSVASTTSSADSFAASAAPDRRDELIEQLYRSLIGLNGDQSNARIDLAFSLYHFEDVFHHILAPVLYRIGEQWEAGLVTVAQEHFASQLVQQRMQQLLRSLPVRPSQPKALAFCPEGEHHQLGLMLFSLFLRSRGLEVIYVGPDTPYDGLIQLIEAKNVRFVVVSLSHARFAPALEMWVEQCRQQLPELKFILGGSGLDPCPPALRPYLLGAAYESWEEWFLTELRV